jgi:hypothetical protein
MIAFSWFLAKVDPKPGTRDSGVEFKDLKVLVSFLIYGLETRVSLMILI